MSTAVMTLAADLAADLRTPPLRTLGEFAEQEIVLPTGLYQGRRFRLDRHPAGRLLYAELDSGRWRRIFITGPNQDGKSLLGFVIPTMHALFERRETVIMGVPSLEIVADKWAEDLYPVIAASRYKEQLPRSGSGSRDGESIAYRFRDATLRFMTAGGNDQSRSSFTTSNLHVTETEGFDRVGAGSAEGTKFNQLERRLLAFAGMGDRLIAESTLSFESGRTWQEIQHGTRSRIALPCPHCAAWVTPEREHFRGWQEAETKAAAIECGRICCPACGSEWSNDQRIEANRHAVLVHRGQEVEPDGTVTGPLPATDTLGFRWTVVNTVLNPRRLAMVAGAEWDAKRAPDEEVAERDMCQSQWALPAKPTKIDLSQLDAMVIMRRTLAHGRGVCPDGTQCITVACDVGKWLCHWTAIAWRPNATPHVLDYGRLEVPSAQMSEEDAIRTALRDWRDEVVGTGWIVGQTPMLPVLRFVDCGDWQDTILSFIAESGEGWFGTKGFGIGQRRSGIHKRDTGSTVVGVGEKYNLVRLPIGQTIIEINADFWKSWLHARVQTPVDKPGALTLFQSNDHLSYSKHLTAEKQVEEFDPKQGTVTRWEAVSRNNHWLDATTLACVAGHAAGMRLVDQEPIPPQRQPQQDSSVQASDWLSRGRAKW